MAHRSRQSTSPYVAAQLELARRERARRRQQHLAQQPLLAWLQETTPAYVWDWPHLVYIQAHLNRVTQGEITKLMIFVPPRHGKSALTTVRYPVFRLEHDPTLRVMLGCYNGDLAALFSREARRIARGRGIAPREINTQVEWDTVAGGSFQAAGVGGGFTGRGAQLIIIDDPIRSRSDANSPRYRDSTYEWYSNDMISRLEPGGAIILIQTRWHEDDLAGRILASDDGPNWTVVCLPAEAEANDPLGREEGAALCPDRYDVAALQAIRRSMGLDYYALYQQRPVSREGGLYKRAWFRYGAPPTDQGALAVDYILQAWDTASGLLGDYSACITFGIKGNEVYILDAFRARLEAPDLLTAINDQAARWSPRAILIEDASSGIAMQQMLRRETRLPIIPVPADRAGKISHANANLPYLEGGRVIFCPGAHLTLLEAELLSFPAGRNDDLVDAFNIGLTRIFGQDQRKMTSHAGR